MSSETMKLVNEQFTKLVKHLPTVSELEYIIEILPMISVDGPWIAGGCLHRTYRNLSLKDADVDVFFKNKEQLDKFLLEFNRVSLNTDRYKIISYTVSEWHHTFTIQYMENELKIQCVCFKYFESIEALFTSFDINVCRIAYDGTKLIMEENTLNDINENQLKFNEGSIYYPSVTLKRLVKYVKMGYNIDDVSLKMLTHAFYKSKKKTIDVLDQDFITKKPINTYEGLK